MTDLFVGNIVRYVGPNKKYFGSSFTIHNFTCREYFDFSANTNSCKPSQMDLVESIIRDILLEEQQDRRLRGLPYEKRYLDTICAPGAAEYARVCDGDHEFVSPISYLQLTDEENDPKLANILIDKYLKCVGRRYEWAWE